MRHSILLAFGVLLSLPLHGYGEDDSFEPPADPEPVNVSLIQYVTLQIDGENEGILICGKRHKITGEVELAEGIAPLEFMMAKLLIHSDRHGESIIFETLAEITLIEGSRYAFTSDLILPAYKTGGEVELRIITIRPGKRGQDPIYREVVTLLPAPDVAPE